MKSDDVSSTHRAGVRSPAGPAPSQASLVGPSCCAPSTSHDAVLDVWCGTVRHLVNRCLAVMCALLPFPLAADGTSVLWKRRSIAALFSSDRDACGVSRAGATRSPLSSSHTTPPFTVDVAPVGSAVLEALPLGRMLQNKDLGALTRGAATIEDVIGTAFASEQLCVVVVHSELSSDSLSFVQELHRLTVAAQSGGVGGIGAAVQEQQDATLPGQRSHLGHPHGVTPSVSSHGNRQERTWHLLSDTVHCYLVSVFSEEFNHVPAAASCAVPALLVYAPVGGAHGMAHIGTLQGAMGLCDAVPFVEQCQEAWSRYQHGAANRATR